MESGLGSSIDVLHEALKIAHTYIFFDENFYRFETVFCIMILGFSPCFICVLCRAKILPHIYTRIIASLKPPPYIYAHYMREKFRLDIYENCGAFGICGRLIGGRYPCVRLYHAFVYVVIVWIGLFSLIGRCQSLIVKVWWNRINSL